MNCAYAAHTKSAVVARIAPDITSGNFQSSVPGRRITAPYPRIRVGPRIGPP